MRAGKVFAISATIIVVACSAWWAASYHPDEFRGAGPMRDTGIFTYYRYHAEVGQLPLAAEATYVLKFSGVPAERMVLQFYVAGGSDANRELLSSLSTELSAEITDERGTVLCSADGPLSNGDRRSGWTLMSSYNQAAFWHDRCSSVSFARNTGYFLRVGVRKVDARSPNVTLTATLEGGGIELS
jgi:hypothetical protein